MLWYYKTIGQTLRLSDVLVTVLLGWCLICYLVTPKDQVKVTFFFCDFKIHLNCMLGRRVRSIEFVRFGNDSMSGERRKKHNV